MGIDNLKLLLFSGGLDSTAVAFWQKPDQLLFIDYGQISADGELRAAGQLAIELGIPLDARRANCRAFGSGHLAGQPALNPELPEVWPFRNQLLITLAAAAYHEQSSLVIQIGTVASDKVHSDGRKQFFFRINKLLAYQSNCRIEAPAIDFTSLQLIRMSKLPSALLAWTFSCHRGNLACGLCRGCTKHYETVAALREFETD